MRGQSPIIECRRLTKVFGPNPASALQLMEAGLDRAAIFEQTSCTVAVRNVCFSVYPGEVFVVMGLSGSGKSTVLRLINRLIESTQGQVIIDGVDVVKMGNAELRALRRERLTMVFQSFALMPHLRVWENAAFGLEVSGMARNVRRERAVEALDQVGLAAHADSLPHELSGGMQQRVGLARALACEPEILLMDEAFSALDPLIRSEMQEQLLELRASKNLTVVFVSHDLDEAMRIGDRIAIMEDGCILQIGTPQHVLEHPANAQVRRFFGGVDVTNVYSAGDLAREEAATIRDHGEGTLRYAVTVLQRLERHHGYVCDREGRFLGVVSLDSIADAVRRGAMRIEEAFIECEPLYETTPFQDVLHRLVHTHYALPVVDPGHSFLGTVSRTVLLETLEREQHG